MKKSHDKGEDDEYYKFANTWIWLKNNFLLYLEKLTGWDVYYPYEKKREEKKNGRP